MFLFLWNFQMTEEISRNPGSYDELHRKCKETQPLCFEGGKLMFQKGKSGLPIPDV
jgi:hypothetical protein